GLSQPDCLWIAVDGAHFGKEKLAGRGWSHDLAPISTRSGNHRDRVIFHEFLRGVRRRHWRRERLLRFRHELFAELQHEALSWPRARFAKGADRLSSDVIRDVLQSIRVLLRSAAFEHAGRDLLHPETALAAGCALSAGFVGVEIV